MGEELENWELSGKQMCGCCPRRCHCPVDLGPRQCTWRIAEVNLWLLILSNLQILYQDQVGQLAIMKAYKEAYLAWDGTLLFFSLLAGYWVRNRDRIQII